MTEIEEIKKKRLTQMVTFWLLVGIFVMIASVMAVPMLREYIGLPFLVIAVFGFSLSGAVLVILTVKAKITGKLKKFLILTGSSATGFLVSVILHNMFYGLGVITSATPLSYLMEAFDVIFFIISVLICPLGFLIGAVGSAYLLLKK